MFLIYLWEFKFEVQTKAIEGQKYIETDRVRGTEMPIEREKEKKRETERQKYIETNRERERVRMRERKRIERKRE